MGTVCLLPIKSEHLNLDKKNTLWLTKTTWNRSLQLGDCIMLKCNVTNTARCPPQSPNLPQLKIAGGLSLQLQNRNSITCLPYYVFCRNPAPLTSWLSHTWANSNRPITNPTGPTKVANSAHTWLSWVHKQCTACSSGAPSEESP